MKRCREDLKQQMEKNSKIYVAGHKGLVGSAIWNNLLSKGYTRLVGRTIDELNLLDQQAVGRFFTDEKPEYVILAAAKVGGIVANNTLRGEFIYENLQIQNNVIHHAWLHGVKKLLFLGSTCIYPRDAPQPMKEEVLLTSPLEYTNEPYAIAKIAGLKLCESYNLQYGTDFIAVMPTNLYGPNDNFDLVKGHVLPALLRRITLAKWLEEENWPAIRHDLNNRPVAGVSGESAENDILRMFDKSGIKREGPASGQMKENVVVEIWGTGTPKREFLWSEEMADACVFIMERVGFRDLAALSQKEDAHKGDESPDLRETRNNHINIGTGKEISIRELAFLIREIIGFKGNLAFDPSKPDGTLRKLTDPSKLHALGWHHQIDIEEGIRRLNSWYHSHS